MKDKNKYFNNTIRRLFFLLFLILTTSCSSMVYSGNYYMDYQIQIYIPDDFNADEKNNILEAISVWNYSFNGKRILYATDYDKKNSLAKQYFKFYKMSPDSNIIKGLDKKYGIKIYGAEKNGKIYLVSDRLNTKHKYLWTVLHEIGHALGEEHNDIKETLLYPYYDEKSKVDCITSDIKITKDMIYCDS